MYHQATRRSWHSRVLHNVIQFESVGHSQIHWVFGGDLWHLIWLSTNSWVSDEIALPKGGFGPCRFARRIEHIASAIWEVYIGSKIPAYFQGFPSWSHRGRSLHRMCRYPVASCALSGANDWERKPTTDPRARPSLPKITAGVVNNALKTPSARGQVW